MHPGMRSTALIEDLNCLACPQEQHRFAGNPSRAREALNRLRWIDVTELRQFERDGWLDRQELDLIERFFGFSRERLTSIPESVDAVSFTRSDPGWQAVREQALELVLALDAFVDIGIPGWGHQYVSNPDTAPKA